MSKNCIICNKRNIYSEKSSCCINCKMDVVRNINNTISNEKNNIRKFYSDKKSKINNKKYYYDKVILYNEIKTSNKLINEIVNKYSSLIKFRKTILEYVDYSNKTINEIDIIIKKIPRSTLDT